MTGLIIPPSVKDAAMRGASLPNTCGACWFGERHGDVVLCKGLPPTPILLGMGQDLAGNPTPQMGQFFAQMQPNTARCALYQSRDIDGAPTAANERAS